MSQINQWYNECAVEKFTYSGMTPRAWRMISYICIGSTIYGMVLVTETLQNYRLNRIDSQMRELERLERSSTVEEITP